MPAKAVSNSIVNFRSVTDLAIMSSMVRAFGCTNPSMTISAWAGIGSPVCRPRTTATGPRFTAPAHSYSFTPSGISRQLARKRIGSIPTIASTGIGSPRAKYLSRWRRPCFPGEMYNPQWDRSWIITR